MSSKKSELVAGLERGLRQRPVISKTDEAFAADGVEFVYGADGIDLAELNDLFKKARRPAFALTLSLTRRSLADLLHNPKKPPPVCACWHCTAHIVPSVGKFPGMRMHAH